MRRHHEKKFYEHLVYESVDDRSIAILGYSTKFDGKKNSGHKGLNVMIETSKSIETFLFVSKLQQKSGEMDRIEQQNCWQAVTWTELQFTRQILNIWHWRRMHCEQMHYYTYWHLSSGDCFVEIRKWISVAIKNTSKNSKKN